MSIYNAVIFVNHFSTEIRVRIRARKGMIRVTEGNDLTISCITTKSWHSCTWEKPMIKKTCRYQYNKHTHGTWKPNQTICDDAYRNLELQGDKVWPDQCGKNNTECTITISDAQISDAGKWTCTVQSCETIKGIGCKKSGAGISEANVTVQVRCINIKCLIATYYDIKYY